MQQIKIVKRIAEELDGLRKLAAFLPSGKANALLNKCARIGKYARKAQAMVDAPVGTLFPKPTRADYDARDNEDIASTYSQRKKMWSLLLAGKVISIENADQIKTRAFASRMSEIRSEIRDKKMPYVLCNKWVYPGGGRSKYKKYWIIDKPEGME